MRESLFDGFLPTVSCMSRCNELIRTTTSEGLYYLENYRIPDALMFENTSVCNLRCEHCFNSYISGDTVSLEDTERVAKELSDNNIKAIHLFKYGDPFADAGVNEKIQILRKPNPKLEIYTSTNGALLHLRDNFEAALQLNQIVFSLDGIDNKSAEIFQKGQSFQQTFNNMSELIRRRDEGHHENLRIVWKYVLFPHNDSDEYIKKAITMAEDIGVDSIQFFLGFNVGKRSGAIWKSEAFLPYMKKYEFVSDDWKSHFVLKLR